MQTIYLETSVLSYLTARPSKSLIAAAWQRETFIWWESRRSEFELFVSEVVIEEAGRGDPRAASKRLAVVEGLPILPLSGDAVGLAASLVDVGALPPKALDDAFHVAIAAVHGIDFLLTLNCRHLSNAEAMPKMRKVIIENGFQCPEIATQMQLMGSDDDD